ncbi:MAG: hypothetical protein SVZ03_02105 [Spirochaetota bacterium]|nr:hypothetical protein [Spirochaetota bacterium]
MKNKVNSITNIISCNIQQYNYIIILLIAMLTTFLSYYFTKQEQNNNYDVFFENDDPAIQLYQKFKKTYGNGDLVAIVFKEDNIFTKDNIKIIRKITNAIKNIDGVQTINKIPTKDWNVFSKQVWCNYGYSDYLVSKRYIRLQDNADEAGLNW